MGQCILESFLTLEREQRGRPITHYPNQHDDVCDAQSARSDGCVSLEEYQEVYSFGKARRTHKDKKKKNKPRSNTTMQPQKTRTTDTPNVKVTHQNSAAKIREQFKSETLTQAQERERQAGTEHREKENLTVSRTEHKRDFSIKITKPRPIPRPLRSTPLKKINQTAIQGGISEEVEGEAINRTFGEKSVQVEELLCGN